MVNDHWKYYEVPADKLEWILNTLKVKGFQWKYRTYGVPIENHFASAVSRDYTGDMPILQMEVWKHYKFITLSTKLLLKVNKNTKEVLSYDSLLKELDLI